MVKQRLSSLSFDYTPPHANFDRSKVKGLVATLTSIPPEHLNKATALEIAAGSKLYNVVVEDERVGKELLQHGKLKKRVTIIPLNKINAFTLSAQVCWRPRPSSSRVSPPITETRPRLSTFSGQGPSRPLPHRLPS